MKEKGNRKASELWAMFYSFFKIGAFTIGGGYAMLPLIDREFVQVRRWITEEEILDVYAIAQSLPGVIAINASICVGYKISKWKGALVASAGMIIPSFVSILVIAMFLVNMQDNPWIQKAFAGVRAGVTAMILLAAIKLNKAILRNPLAWIIACLSCAALVVGNISAILVIAASALTGFVLFGLLKLKAGTKP